MLRIYLVALLLGLAALGAEPHWEKVSDHDGITVYRAQTPGSPILAFKGIGTIDAPIAKVASVLADTSRRREWVPHLIEGKIIRTISDRERIEYTSLETPPFTKNRDFVLRARAEFREPTRELYFHFTSTEDPEAPKTDMVRGQVLDSHYLMRPEGENKTFLEYLVHVDPKGGIPRWLVNLVQKGIPRTTLESIRKQVAKPDVVELPVVKTLFVTEAPRETRTN